jgi:hypothetical protein
VAEAASSGSSKAFLRWSVVSTSLKETTDGHGERRMNTDIRTRRAAMRGSSRGRYGRFDATDFGDLSNPPPKKLLYILIIGG